MNLWRTCGRVSLAAVTACGGTVTLGTPLDGGGSQNDTASNASISTTQHVDAGPPAPRDPATVECCADSQCSSGESCCLYNGHCYDSAASPELCPKGPKSLPGSAGAPACYSNAQCGSTEICKTLLNGVCLTAGTCMERDNCGACGSDYPDYCTVCGGDGVTYANTQTACLAGVSADVQGACGVGDPVVDQSVDEGYQRIGCGSDAQCSDGMKCCLITASCVDPSCSVCCSFPPEGTRVACRDDKDCVAGREYCAGSGCGTPGGCVAIQSTTNCSGEITTVCGCDGKSYFNSCWAAGAGTRVASSGMCP